jgi:PhnB protein
MLANPPRDMPRITPYLLYKDVAVALDWLSRVFGFTERVRMPAADGSILHAEMAYADGVVMMGCPGPDYQNPRAVGHATQGLYVYVDDVDAHFAHAKDAGATILAEPQDQFYGDRNYRAEEPEGHQWTFAQHVKDVAQEDMHPPE